MTAFLVGLICGVAIGVVLGFASSSLFIVGGKDTPTQHAGPRLPHHRNNIVAMRPLPEWQEHQRDVDHLDAVSKASREDAFWMGEKK